MSRKKQTSKAMGQLKDSTTALVDRRAVIGGAAALFSVAATRRTARAASLDKLTVRLNWSTEGQHAPFFLSAQKGWFKAAGLDVLVEDGNGSVITVQLVANGQFDIGQAALASMAIGAAKGSPVISVAGFVQKGDVGICVPQDSGWSRPSDLIGKRICYTAGSLEGPFVRPFFRKNGVPDDKIKLINVEASAKLSTYLNNSADGVATSVPWLLPILVDKRPSKGILFADFGLNLPGNGLVVRQETLKKKGDAIKRFTSVLCAAWAYIYNGHEEEAVNAIRVARPHAVLTQKQLLGQIVAYHKNVHSTATKDLPIGVQSTDDWQKTIEAMESVKVIGAGFKPDRFFTNDYIDFKYAKTKVPV